VDSDEAGVRICGNRPGVRIQRFLSLKRTR
jgi:hypothetical protein